MELPKERECGDRESTEQQETCQCREASVAAQDLTACLLREAERAEAQLKRAVEAHEERVQGMMADVLQRMEEARWTFVAEFLSQRAAQRRLRRRLREEEERAATDVPHHPRHPPAAAQDVLPGWGLDQEEESVRKRRRCEHTPSNWDLKHPGPYTRCFLRRQGWPNVRDDNHCNNCLNDRCVHFRDKSDCVSKGLVHLYNKHVQSDYCSRFDEIREISDNTQDIYVKNRDSFFISRPFSHASTQTCDCKETRNESTCTLLFKRQHCSCERCAEHIKDQQRPYKCIDKKNRTFHNDGRSECTRKNDTSLAYGDKKQGHINADQQCCTHRKECGAYMSRGETYGDRGDFCHYSCKDVNRRHRSEPTTSCPRPFRCARPSRPDGFSKSVGELPAPWKGFADQGIRFHRDSLSKRQWSKCSVSSSTSRRRRSRRKPVDSHALSFPTTAPNIPPPSSRKVEATDSQRINSDRRAGATGRATPAGETWPLRLQGDVQRRLVALIDARDALLTGVASGGRGSVVDESLFAVAAVNAQIRRLLCSGDAHRRPAPTCKLAS